jgi:hypothetical protein
VHNSEPFVPANAGRASEFQSAAYGPAWLHFPFDPSEAAVALDGGGTESDGLGMTLAKVQEGVKGLSAHDRAELLDWLWDSLQPEGVLQVQERWAVESEERIDAVDRGELSTMDGPTAMEQLRRSLGA